jgi:hypothetical protein
MDLISDILNFMPNFKTIYKESTQEMTKSNVGTGQYAAPEIDNVNPYDFKVDVWYFNFIKKISL